jgi:hypothetical protein
MGRFIHFFLSLHRYFLILPLHGGPYIVAPGQRRCNGQPRGREENTATHTREGAAR